MPKAIIYCRKSTDRDDRQQNSLEHQLSNCRSSCKRFGFEILEEITESVSAKIEGKRPGFNRMMIMCRKEKVDYIVIDEPKRISRNTLDSSLVVHTLEKDYIRGLVTTTRTYEGKNSTDILLLELDLGMSKKDNKDRATDVKNKMLSAFKNRRKPMGKAPFGYKNITIKKGHHDIEIEEEKAEVVRRIFIMRSKGNKLPAIAKYLNDLGIKAKIRNKWSTQSIFNILRNHFYYGLMKWGGEEVIGDYQPIISKELFDRVTLFENTKTKGINEKPANNPGVIFYFNGILKDSSGIKMSGYLKKGNKYYHNQRRSKHVINVSEKNLFKTLEGEMKHYNFPKSISKLSRAILKDLYDDKIKNETKINKDLKNDLEITKDRRKSLIDKYLDGDIDKNTYKSKLTELDNRLIETEEKIKSIEQGGSNTLQLIETWCELVDNLYESYKSGNDEKKGKILRAMQCELFINDKKELKVKENKLFELIKRLNNEAWYTQQDSNLRP